MGKHLESLFPSKVAPRDDVQAWGTKDTATGLMPVYKANGSLWFVIDLRDEPSNDPPQSKGPMDAMVGTFVYFIGGDETPIKIGFSAHPQSRLNGLQTAHWVKLRILAAVRGTKEDEAAYHRMFASLRMSGEWFERHPDILAEIERLTSPSPHPLPEQVIL